MLNIYIIPLDHPTSYILHSIKQPPMEKEKEIHAKPRMIFLDSIMEEDYEKVYELLMTIPDIIKQVDQNNKNPIHYASLYSKSNLDIIELLLRHESIGDLINECDNDQDRPLDVAIKYNFGNPYKDDIIRLLTQHGGIKTQ